MNKTTKTLLALMGALAFAGTAIAAPGFAHAPMGGIGHHHGGRLLHHADRRVPLEQGAREDEASAEGEGRDRFGDEKDLLEITFDL